MTEQETLERLANRLRILSERGLNTSAECRRAVQNIVHLGTPYTDNAWEQGAISLLMKQGVEWYYMPDDLASIPVDKIQSTITAMEQSLSNEYTREMMEFAELDVMLLYRRLWQVPIESNPNPQFFDGEEITEKDIPY